MLDQKVFDVGAHQGEDTDYYLKRGFTVVAFECNPHNVSVLERRFKSEIATGKVQIETRALMEGGEGRTLEFFCDANSVWGTTKSDWAQRNNLLGSSQTPIKVACIEPSTIFGLYGTPYYMKIDIEGADLEALSSLNALEPTRRPRYVSIESNKRDFAELVKEFDLLHSLGYTKFQLVGQRNNYKKVTSWVTDGKTVSYTHLQHSSGPFGLDLDPSKWITRQKALSRYKRIFLQYRLFGDYGIFNLARLPRFFRYLILLPLWWGVFAPDWYDTHATSRVDGDG